MAIQKTRGSVKGKSEFSHYLEKAAETYNAGQEYEGMTFDDIPAGTYIVKSGLIELRLSSNKNLMLHREHIIVEGDFTGAQINDNMMLGMSSFGDGRVRQYIRIVTGEPAPTDPQDLESIISKLNSDLAYEAKIKLKYEGEDGSFKRVDVLNVEQISEAEEANEATEATEATEAEEATEEEQAEVEEATEDDGTLAGLVDFCNEIGITLESETDVQSIISELEKYEFDEADLSTEQIDLLTSLSLENLIIKKPATKPAPKVAPKAVSSLPPVKRIVNKVPPKPAPLPPLKSRR